MEWLVLIVIVITIAVIAQMSSNKKKAEEHRANVLEYSNEIENAKNSLLKDAGKTEILALAPSEYEYRPVGRETLLAVQPGVSRLEYKSAGQYRTRGASISIPIVKGIRYRIGSGTISTEKSGRQRPSVDC